MKELDVKNFLPKIRNSDSIIRGLVRTEYMEAMKYHKDMIIAPDFPTDSSGQDVSSEGENYTTN